MNKIIMCNGEYRSGSTWLFNVVLGLVKGSGISGKRFESLGVDQEDGDSLSALRPNLLRTWWVLKCHVFVPTKKFDHVRHIRTHRSPWAILASHMYIKSLKTLTDEQIIKFCRGIRMSRSITDAHETRDDCLTIDYPKLFLLPREVIDEVDAFIGSNASEDVKDNLCSALAIQRIKRKTGKMQRADMYTQWRPNHISDQNGAIDGWMNVLDEELMKRVEAVGW